MFRPEWSRMMRRQMLLVMGLLTVLLTGCQNVQDSLYETAINFERSRAGLEPAQVTAGNIDFAFLQGGKIDGETILMVHGFGANKDNWVRLAGELGDDYRVLAIDLAGHGESSQFENTKGEKIDYLIASQADRLAAFLKEVNVEKVHYMGNSMGGAIGLQFAKEYPEYLRSLVLLDNAGIESPDKSEYFKLLEKGENPLIARNPGDYEALLDFVTHDAPFIPWPMTAVLERKALARAQLNDQIFADMMKSRDDMGSADDMNVMLQAIKTPSLVIWGQEDRVLDVSSVEVMLKHMPKLEAVILPEIGHLPMLEAPSDVNDAFRKFAGTL